MGLLANSVSVTQYLVTGEIPPGDFFEWSSGCLSRNAFRAIDDTADEISVGWVHLDDFRESGFDTPRAFWRDRWLVFSMRTDTRKVPAALLKAYIQVEEAEFLAAHPGMRRVPKQRREELREKVKLALLARTLPAPAVIDAVWDTEGGILTLATTGRKGMDDFETLFRKTFPGLGLSLYHPLARAERVAGEQLLPLVKEANRASAPGVLAAMKENRWLGCEFFLWLMYGTMNESSEYRVLRPGPAGAGDPFVAYVNDRVVLVGGGDEGAQKITVAGPQDLFSEVRTALRGGKEITDATLYLEKDENLWRTTLKGESFQFGSLKSPTVKIEKDDLDREMDEREAVFYERMHLLETAMQVFDSLFLQFLKARLDGGWEGASAAIRQWLEES